MVQDNTQSREPFPPRPYWNSTQDRFPMSSIPDEGRYTDSQDVRRRPIGIDEALREYCNISAEFYVVIPVIEGKPAIFTAPNMPSIDIKRFLDVEALSRELRRAQAVATTPSYADPDFGFEPEVNQYPMSVEARRRWAQERRYGQPMGLTNIEEEGVPHKARKRPRASVSRREPQASFDSDEAITSTPPLRQLIIGDSDEVWKAYDERFKSIQQGACKLIAKAWVKAVEPKKQSTHPYTGADEKAPTWWPKPWGPGKEHRVRHKEPDHLYKRERVHLLIHILRMIVEPNYKQHPTVRKLYLNVAKLEEVTNDALSAFFLDKDNPANSAKKPFLKEIFRIAKNEERLKDGQIDESLAMYIMPKDKIPLGYMSDTEEVTPGREDGEQNQATNSSGSSPQRASVSQGLIAQTTHSTEPSPTTTQMSHDGFVSDVTGVRANTHQQYTQQQPAVSLGQEVTGAEQQQRQSYVDTTPSMSSQQQRQSFVDTASNNMSSQNTLQQHPTTNLNLHHTDLYSTSPHDASRRSSMFTSTPSDYTSPAVTPTMYNPAQWQTQTQSTNTVAPSTPSIYAAYHQQQSYGAHASNMAMPDTTSTYLGASFDGMPRSQHLLRPMQGSGYSGYLPHDAAGGGGGGGGHLSAAGTKSEPMTGRHAGQ